MARMESYSGGALVGLTTNGTQPGEPAAGVYDGNGVRQRALTAVETALLAGQDAGQVAGTNQATLQGKAQQALTANATFQAIASPSNAQIAAQVQALTKQSNGVIRLLLNALDSTAGT